MTLYVGAINAPAKSNPAIVRASSGGDARDRGFGDALGAAFDLRKQQAQPRQASEQKDVQGNKRSDRPDPKSERRVDPRRSESRDTGRRTQEDIVSDADRQAAGDQVEPRPVDTNDLQADDVSKSADGLASVSVSDAGADAGSGEETAEQPLEDVLIAAGEAGVLLSSEVATAAQASLAAAVQQDSESFGQQLATAGDERLLAGATVEKISGLESLVTAGRWRQAEVSTANEGSIESFTASESDVATDSAIDLSALTEVDAEPKTFATADAEIAERLSAKAPVQVVATAAGKQPLPEQPATSETTPGDTAGLAVVEDSAARGFGESGDGEQEQQGGENPARQSLLAQRGTEPVAAASDGARTWATAAADVINSLTVAPTTASGATIQTNGAQLAQPVDLAAELALASQQSVDDIDAEQFAGNNHGRILTAVRGQLLPNGGDVAMRLDPPELGVLQIRMEVRDGTVTASFQAENAQAADLLTQGMTRLKQSLERAGIMVDRLSVQMTGPVERSGNDRSAGDQASRDSSRDGGGQRGGFDGGAGGYGDDSARRQSQRDRAFDAAWRAINGDPIDILI